jgi:CRP-like cAMP-binding protein
MKNNGDNLETQETSDNLLYHKLHDHNKINKKQLYNFFKLYGEQRLYSKHNAIFQIEDIAQEAYCIESGMVKTSQLTLEGKEVTFQILNPGDGFGMAEVFLNCRRTRYAEAMRKTTLWVINKDRLSDLIFSNKEFCLSLLKGLHYEVLKLQGIVEYLAISPVRDRVVKLLARLCKEQGRRMQNYTIIDFPITHEEIAKMVGSSRKTITIILNDMRKQGILGWEKKKIKVFGFDELI